VTLRSGLNQSGNEIAKRASRSGFAVSRAVRSTDHAIKRWALGLPRWIGRAATIALLAVLLGLIIFSSTLSAGFQTRSADNQRAANLNTALHSAHDLLEAEKALGLQYRLTPSNQYVLDFDLAASSFNAALVDWVTIEPVDRPTVQRVELVNASYMDATHRLFAAVDHGDVARVNSIAVGEMGDLFSQIEDLLKRATLQHENESAVALSEQLSYANDSLRGRVLVEGGALLLVGFLALVLEVNRRARDAKSSVMARVSHELRTPLNSILGFSQLILLNEGATLNDKQRRYIENIQSGGSHLLALINDVLDMSKVEAGKMVMDVVPTAVDEVIDTALEEIAPLIAAKKINILASIGTRGLIISADRMRLRQIFMNGLSNAIKFTGPGGTIQFATHSAKGMAWIELADTGCGIPAEHLARMFEDFEQIDNSQTRTGEGTGLGLPLSKGLAEMMGGSLSLTSREGQGTTFQVRMQLAPAPAKAGHSKDRQISVASV
jgi:signal transduction histidine kinase